MAAHWRLGLLLASWGCVASGEQRGWAARSADAPSQRQQQSNHVCSWPVTPRIMQGSRLVSLKTAVLGEEGFPAELRLSIEVEGDRLLLNLVQNRELLEGTRGFVYDLPNGTRAVQPSSTKGNCCYRGGIQRYLNSWANICVCSGLSGLLFISKFRSYSLESSPDGRTRAYRLEELGQTTRECRLRRRFHPQLDPKQMPPHRARRELEPELERGYVELVIVADQSEFKLDPNINRTRTRILEIASHIDGFYRTLDLRVALVGAEVWNSRNRVSTNGTAEEVLERFLQWRQRDLLLRIPHDSVQLIIGPPFTGGVIGASTQGSICSKRSGGISVGHSVSPLIMASTLSHHLGHNLGLLHDGNSCGCNSSTRPPSRRCIMDPPMGIMPGLSFSSCSQQQIRQILQSNRIGCLLDLPDPGRLQESQCGNHFVESGEECDCGLQLECKDPCCNASTCRLQPGAQCATGEPCCHQCKVRHAGFVCRAARNECDLPEFCDGASSRCLPNIHKQDGTPCDGGRAVCYGGICPTYLSQCQELWGPGSFPLSEGCVSSLNMRGDVEGHCGRTHSGSYIPCAKSNVWCGQLQCGGGLTQGKQNGTLTTLGCSHNRLDMAAADVLDEALALPGTICGPSKVCIDARCQDLSSLKVPGCKCNGHGVCNSNGHCHCQPGWAPPDCQSSGLGGSVDSGPPAPEETSKATSTVLVLIALLLVTLLAIGLCCAKRMGLHKRLCQFGKGTSCQYRTEAESRVRFLRPAERITQPEPQSYSKAPPDRPRPPQWRQSTELQLMPTSKQPTSLRAPRPDPPSKPLPPDPVPKDPQGLAQDRPAPPRRPLPANPIPKEAQFPRPVKPPPPRKPLPSDPPQPLCAEPSCDPQVQMLPSRPAPPPPSTLSSSSGRLQEI